MTTYRLTRNTRIIVDGDTFYPQLFTNGWVTLVGCSSLYEAMKSLEV